MPLLLDVKIDYDMSKDLIKSIRDGRKKYKELEDMKCHMK